MLPVAQIEERDEERDRKTCIALDAKVTGSSRELAQWLVDHPRYSAPVVAEWLGCGDYRIKALRRWASDGFPGGTYRSNSNRSDASRRHGADAALESQENSEQESPEEGEQYVADPVEVAENLRFSIARHHASAEAYRKIIKASRLEDGARREIRVAIERLIDKWKSVLSTLERQEAQNGKEN